MSRRVRMPQISPRGFERLALFAVLAVAFIIVSGAAVRLSGSGLGCTDWPNCEENTLIAPLEYHAWVEFGNRLITGLVSIAVVLAVLGSLRRVPRRRDLTRLSWGLVAGVAGQVVLGAVAVAMELAPPFVMAHFLLSILLLADALVLLERSRQPDGAAATWVVEPIVQRLSWTMLALTCAALVAGTVVTATGPHGGDEEARRFGFSLPHVTRIHGIIVMLLIATTVLLFLVARRTRAPEAFRRRVELLTAALALQAVIGYTQYFTDVPPLLVGFHVAGAVVVFVSASAVVMGMRAPVVELAGSLEGDGKSRSPVYT